MLLLPKLDRFVLNLPIKEIVVAEYERESFTVHPKICHGSSFVMFLLAQCSITGQSYENIAKWWSPQLALLL